MSDFLVGKTIKDFKISDDAKALLFVTEEGDCVVKVEGDCCSDSWIEHIELPAMGWPAKVVSVEDLDFPESDGSSVYGCKITTNRGVIIIDYRNESDGDYGGNIVWPDDPPFDGGVYGQNISNEKWVGIVT